MDGWIGLLALPHCLAGELLTLILISKLLNSMVACSCTSAERRNLDESQSGCIFVGSGMFGHLCADCGIARWMVRGSRPS